MEKTAEVKDLWLLKELRLLKVIRIEGLTGNLQQLTRNWDYLVNRREISICSVKPSGIVKKKIK